MKKNIALIVALGCAYVGAASTVNYDLLGRKGSKMNSPMVYKNVDYSKAKKNEQQKVGSSLENRSLAKVGVGLKEDIVALEGIYTNHPSKTPFVLSEHHSSWDQPNRTFVHLYSHGYMNESNRWFFDVGNDAGGPQRPNYNAGVTSEPNYVGNVHGATGYRVDEYTHDFANAHWGTSPYGDYQQINYLSFSLIDILLARRSYISSWYNDISSPSPNPAIYSGQWGYTGIYLTGNARPVKIDSEKDVICKVNPQDRFSTAPEDEMRASRIYSVVDATSLFSNIYVTKQSPEDPTAAQLYVGLHSDKGTSTSTYSAEAKALDNYIYKYRTVEIVAAGNNGASSGDLEAKAHSANAITVGAYDLNSNDGITRYTSWKPSACGAQKPEIYNFSHFYMNDNRRTYTKQNTTYTYQPFYDGTETAAAYTAGEVSDLLAVNPFYRRHPEVVKALLIASGDYPMNIQNNSHDPVTTRIPTYLSVISDWKHTNQIHESRYWIGQFDKIATHAEGNKYQIRFSVKTSGFGSNSYSAAIAWLSSGNDISKYGKIPQDFDLAVYPSNDGDLDNIYVDHRLDASVSYLNPFEKVTFTTNANYVVFVITLLTEWSKSENKGQIVMGFDMTREDPMN